MLQGLKANNFIEAKSCVKSLKAKIFLLKQNHFIEAKSFKSLKAK